MSLVGALTRRAAGAAYARLGVVFIYFHGSASVRLTLHAEAAVAKLS